ncbi:MAG TPA: hypothetical protein VKZ53_12980 [Candidatus Angelobacter sp.]|nr:hypothetical protein [Candidatus Angelobacter sp.]
MNKHKIPDTMQSIVDRKGLDLLCNLMVAYRGVSSFGGNWHSKVQSALADLKSHLGHEEFGRFQFDLVRKMNFVPAPSAVMEIIGAAVKRRRAARTEKTESAVAV